jgi:HK97 family phage prohead protease
MAQKRVGIELFKAALKSQSKELADLCPVKAGPSDVEVQNDALIFTFSDGSVDRQGDTINPNGWKLENWQKAGGPILWAHDYSAPSIGKCPRVWVENASALKGEVQFASEASPFAAMIERLVRGGFLKCMSVGFKPLKYVINEERAGSDSWCPPVDFIEQELLEVSNTPVPANPNALLDAKTLGIDLDPLAEWASKAMVAKDLWTPGDSRAYRKQLQDIYDATKSGQRTFLMGQAPVAKAVTPSVEVRTVTVTSTDPAEITAQVAGAVAAPAPQPAQTKSIDDMVAGAQKMAADLKAAADERDALQKLVTELEAAIKAGRVLSAANEEKIRAAVASLTEVLAQLEPVPTEQDSIDLDAIKMGDEVTFDFGAAAPAGGN